MILPSKSCSIKDNNELSQMSFVKFCNVRGHNLKETANLSIHTVPMQLLLYKSTQISIVSNQRCGFIFMYFELIFYCDCFIDVFHPTIGYRKTYF